MNSASLKKKPFWQYFLFVLIGIFLLVFLVCLSFALNYYRRFSSSAKINHTDIKKHLLDAKINSPQNFNLLILGLDWRKNSGGLLTDTIIAGLWRPQSNRAVFVSLPRDLWLDHLKTKINALYFYGREQNYNDKTSLITTELEKVLGEPLDYYLILDFEVMAEIIDLLSGVEIEVERAFDDYYFPADDGTNNLTHLRFEAGRQTMNGNRVLEYIRSRKSDDLQEGTDEARTKRQQKVLLAIIDKISNRQFLATNPEAAGKLYRYWQDNVETNLPISLLINASLAYVRQEMRLEFLSLPEEFLANPPIEKHGLWVWEPIDKSWGEIREWTRNKSGLQ